MSQYFLGEIYEGEEKIVVAMDIGTTHSAVSFAHLSKDEEPLVYMVTDWPGQSGVAKIPTIAAYDGTQGIKWGQEAVDWGKKGYAIAKWFKLHLHPPSMRVPARKGAHFEIPALPNDVKIQEIYADFMAYLMESTQKFFETRLPNGAKIWRRLRHSALIILTIPNGWDQTEQQILHNAAVQAKLVTKDNCLEFVSEAEASVHWAVAHRRLAWLSEDVVFGVVDAGGSTVDSTLYNCVATKPKLILHEACTTGSECVQAGGISVDRAARTLLATKLKGSKFAQPKNLDRIEASFKDDVKNSFDGTQRDMGVTVGGAYEVDKSLSVTDGTLLLEQQQISYTFEDVIKRIKQSICKLMGGHNVTHLLLVGGFGESPYLQKVLDRDFRAMGVSIVIIGDPSKKAAAEGALLWFLKQTVTTRVARVTLGMEVTPNYDRTNPEHWKRRAHRTPAANGTKLVPDGFCVLIEKGEVINQDFAREQEFGVFCESAMEDECAFTLYVWEGEGTPKWITDTRELQDRDGNEFYEINFKVVIKPQGTQLQAVLRAQYNDTICEGPITFVPNAISHDAEE